MDSTRVLFCHYVVTFNHLYLLSKAAPRIAIDLSHVILDYGCGSGEIIGEGRRAGLEVYGCRGLLEGSNIRQEIEKKGWLGTVVREVENGVIPFENCFFDMVTRNHVIEHVENLDAVLREIHRVLKPGGRFLSLFPTKEIIREGHCGIPLIHWFSRRSPYRFCYALTLRLFGLGYFTGKEIIVAMGE